MGIRSGWVNRREKDKNETPYCTLHREKAGIILWMFYDPAKKNELKHLESVTRAREVALRCVRGSPIRRDSGRNSHKCKQIPGAEHDDGNHQIWEASSSGRFKT